jgi:glycosyltransferase involved in cell wall biosynthesis
MAMRDYELRNGIPVHRPATPVIPKIGSAIWVDLAAFLFSLRTARKLNRSIRFDAIISFDLLETGSMGWRLARSLGIPAAGWAFGSDMRHPKDSPLGRVVARAIQRLDVIFYQSRELLQKAATLLNTSEDDLSSARHIILPHGIPEPPDIPRATVREQVRKELEVSEHEVLLLYTGRIVVKKGLLELLDALQLSAARNPAIKCIMLGSHPAYDETAAIQQRIEKSPLLKRHVRILPACPVGKVWEYLCAADVFVFPSHNEGMSNSLLEAMAFGLPAVAFAIAAVQELEAGCGAPVMVPCFDSTLLAEAILRLAESRDKRCTLGTKGRERVMSSFMIKKNSSIALRHIAELVRNHGVLRPAVV